MSHKKKNIQTKSKLHPRSQHRQRYDFEVLTKQSPELNTFVSPNKYGDLSVNFFNPEAVKALNKALLKHHYNIEYWDIPDQYLCPPIPGRADYIHYLADLIGETSHNPEIIGLDIGTGASCIYPIIGNQSYGWQFIGTDIDEKAVKSSNAIISNNEVLKGKIEIRLQKNIAHKLKGVLSSEEKVTFVMCNPPFHASAEDAKKASQRKLKNLNGKSSKKKTLNFGGQHKELWCKGGEVRFIKDLIYESRHFAKQCKWFTTLVSKESNLKRIYSDLKIVIAVDIKTIQMGQGQKISRIIAWRFL